MNHTRDIAIIFGVCLHLVTACILADRFINSTETIVVRASETDAPAGEADTGSTMEESGGGETVEPEEDSMSEKTPSPSPTVEEYIEQVFGGDAESAKIVAFCESSMNPKAKSNISSATGLYQIITSTWEANECGGVRTNAYDNIDCAYEIFKASGERWSTSNGWEASSHCHGQY